MRVNPAVSQNIQQSDESKKATATEKSARADKLAELKKNHGFPSTESAKSEISAKGREFAQAHAVAKSAPDVREDRIAELKKKIAEGKYEIDSNELADKMVSEHMGL